jgi:hypothetical protein
LLHIQLTARVHVAPICCRHRAVATSLRVTARGARAGTPCRVRA